MEEEDAASGNTFFFAIREICGCIPSRFKNPTLEAPVFRKQFRKGGREGEKELDFSGKRKQAVKRVQVQTVLKKVLAQKCSIILPRLWT